RVDAAGDAAYASEMPKSRFLRSMVGRLSRLPVPVLAEISNPVAECILSLTRVNQLQVRNLGILWDRLLQALRGMPDRDRDPEDPPDWAGEALNAPAGKLAQALMAESRDADAGQPEALSRRWLERAEALLSLGGDMRRQV